MSCGAPIRRDNMGFDFGLQDPTICFPTRNRWLFTIHDVSADQQSSSSITCLPPTKSARPALSFKEMEVRHLTETVYYPIRPEWRPIDLVLYDIRGSKNPVFRWLETLYIPQTGRWLPILDEQTGTYRTATLTLYTGCGDVIETWVYENCWPKDIDWGELDMGAYDILTAKVTLRFARAYLCNSNNSNASGNPVSQNTPQN